MLPQDSVAPRTSVGRALTVEEIASIVVRWYRKHGRAFPWRLTRDPYHLLLAETLLIQTQAERVVKPYLDLVARYPNVYSLAGADVPKLGEWFRPLGLVKRADLLVRTARLLIEEHEGQVPGELRALMALPGVGRYSARAILCLGFGVSVPMIDEGSGRVPRRLLRREQKGPAYSDRGLMAAAEQMLPEQSTREFNLGLLDIASEYCHVHNPDCHRCPLRRVCQSACCGRR